MKEREGERKRDADKENALGALSVGLINTCDENRLLSHNNQ